jgi:ribosome-binding ATPase YchF (GTP1/OBG family)
VKHLFGARVPPLVSPPVKTQNPPLNSSIQNNKTTTRQVESELKDMPPDEAKEWLEMLGVTDGGLSSLVRATYRTLGLQTYFTTGARGGLARFWFWLGVEE